MKKVLVLEDEASIRSFIVINLQRAGYEVVEAECGEEALQKLQENPDTKLCLLDIMLPDIDGFEVCRRIRMSNAQVGIIMLTARTQEMDKVTGLMTGADDYVTKPFSVPELMARVKTNLRRAPELLPQKELVFEDIRMDLAEKKVFRGDKYIHLGPTEFRLLRMLMETPGKVFSREFLLKNVWGNNIYVESRTVDVHIRRLRKSLNEFGPDYIRTVRATGYAIDNSLGEEDADGEK